MNYNNALFDKGLLLRTTNAVRDALYSSGDTGLIEQFESLRALRERISALQQKNDTDRSLVQQLEDEAERIDKTLTRQPAAFSKFKAGMNTRWQDVEKSLKPGEAAVKFVSFQLYDTKWTDKSIYAALIVRPKSKTPVWVPLCEETQLKELFAKTEGRNVEQQTRILYDIFGSQIYTTVWSL